VYDERSAEICQFDALTGVIFEELRAGGRPVAGLVTALSERLEVVADMELERLVVEILSLLNSKDLAAQVGR
jgi:hypothetical protein